MKLVTLTGGSLIGTREPHLKTLWKFHAGKLINNLFATCKTLQWSLYLDLKHNNAASEVMHVSWIAFIRAVQCRVRRLKQSKSNRSKSILSDSTNNNIYISKWQLPCHLRYFKHLSYFCFCSVSVMTWSKSLPKLIWQLIIILFKT